MYIVNMEATHMNRDSAALDRHITGNYGEDQFRTSASPSYTEQRDNFLDSLVMDAAELGHSLFPWTKGKHGFHTHCKNCGKVVRCVVSRFKVKEFPAEVCAWEPCAECGQVRKHQNHWAPFGFHNFVSQKDVQ